MLKQCRKKVGVLQMRFNELLRLHACPPGLSPSSAGRRGHGWAQLTGPSFHCTPLRCSAAQKQLEMQCNAGAQCQMWLSNISEPSSWPFETWKHEVQMARRFNLTIFNCIRLAPDWQPFSVFFRSASAESYSRIKHSSQSPSPSNASHHLAVRTPCSNAGPTCEKLSAVATGPHVFDKSIQVYTECFQIRQHACRTVAEDRNP